MPETSVGSEVRHSAMSLPVKYLNNYITTLDFVGLDLAPVNLK